MRRRTPTRRHEVSCSACGLPASGPPPERCPICGAETWEPRPWRPFSGSGIRPVLAALRARTIAGRGGGAGSGQPA